MLVSVFVRSIPFLGRAKCAQERRIDEQVCKVDASILGPCSASLGVGAARVDLQSSCCCYRRLRSS